MNGSKTLLRRRHAPMTSKAPWPVDTVGMAPPPNTRRAYLMALSWAFAFFNAVRVLTYLPTIWAIHASGQSEQHSLVTWLGWMGANLTMAAWLHEHNGQRLDRAVLINAANALMCGLTALVILWFRV